MAVCGSLSCVMAVQLWLSCVTAVARSLVLWPCVARSHVLKLLWLFCVYVCGSLTCIMTVCGSLSCVMAVCTTSFSSAVIMFCECGSLVVCALC